MTLHGTALAIAARKTPNARPLHRLGNFVLGDLGKTAAGKPSVFRTRVHLRGLGDITCSIDPATGGRVCSSDGSTSTTATPGVVVPPDGTLVKGSGPAVDLIQNGQRRWIPNPDTFNCMGFNWAAIQTLPDTQYNSIPSGPAFPSIGPYPNCGAQSASTIQPAAPATPMPAPFVASAAPTSVPASKPTDWTKIALIGGGVVVGGLFLKKILK